MPDTLKQFYNATINVTGLTGNQTAALFTNNATTRAVIKDVEVLNTFPAQPNLTVAGTAVASLAGSVTGSEIADISQTVGISFATPLEFSQLSLQYYSSSTPASWGSRTATSSFRINGLSAKETASVLQNAIPSTYTIYGHHYVAADNDVFYVQQNGTLNFRLTKNAGGPTGTATDIVSSSFPVAYDGRYYYYLTSTTNLRRFDPEAETTTDTTISSVSGQASGARMIHSNGYLCYIPENTDSPYIIKISNGFWSRLTGYYNIGGIYTGNGRSMPGFFIDPVTLVVTIFFVDGTHITTKSKTIGAASPSSFTVANEVNSITPFSITKAANSWQPFNSTLQQPVLALADAVTLMMLFSNNVSYLVDCTSDTSTSLWQQRTALNQTSKPDFFFTVTTPTPAVDTTNFPSTISLRVTGVEVTP